MNVRALIVIGVVMAALVIVFMFTGLLRGASAPDDLSPDWLGILERDDRLSAADIRAAQPAACGQQFADGSITIGAGAECRLAVRPLDSFLPKTRITVLDLAIGQRLDVTVTQPDIVTIKLEHRSGDQQTYRLFGDGGSIAMRCTQPGPNGFCVVRVS